MAVSGSREQVKERSWTVREVALAGLFAALTAVGAMVSIPLPMGVPFSLQVLVSLLTGAVLGARAGALSQAIYLLMGAVGLPVFAGRTGGLQVLVGLTGGYLVGFVVAAWVVGRLTERCSPIPPGRGAAAMAAGLAAIYLPGALVLALHWGSLPRALYYGVLVYLPLDLVKAVAAYSIARGLEARGIARPVGAVRSP